MRDCATAYEAVTRALQGQRGTRPVHIDIDVDAQTARKIAQVIAAELAGGAVVFSRVEDLTTTQAALILGVSRPTLIKMLENGDLPYHLAGSHKRVMASDIQSYVEDDRARMREGMREMNEIVEHGANDGLRTAPAR